MASGIVANTNIPSINASRVLSKNRSDLERSMERLASGKRINSAQDDAAGLAVASKMRADAKSFNVAVRNINDGISLLQTYDGAASEIEAMLTRMREIAVQMSNETYDTVDYAYAAAEYIELNSQISDISANLEFNRVDIGASVSKVIKTGALSTDADEISLALNTLAVNGSVAAATADLSDSDEFSGEITVLDSALDALATARAEAGGYLSRLGFQLSNAQNQGQRLTQALSAVEDADYSAESAALARGMVLAQAGTAMLAQANQAPQYILTLLRG